MKKCPSPTGFFKVDNLFGELLTEAHKSQARQNLGIPDSNALIWGNIKGQIGNQQDLRELVYRLSKEESKKQVAILLNTSPETLTVLEVIAKWLLEDASGTTQLVQTVGINSQDIQNIKESTVYLTEDEYANLVANGMVKENVEYNIYEDV